MTIQRRISLCVQRLTRNCARIVYDKFNFRFTSAYLYHVQRVFCRDSCRTGAILARWQLSKAGSSSTYSTEKEIDLFWYVDFFRNIVLIIDL